MLVVISPAKRLDWSALETPTTLPAFQADANRLAATARQLSLAKLKDLMDLSDDLARLNRDRFRDFAPQSTPENAKAALFAFAGDTYQGFDAASLDEDGLRWAQDHLGILSGLYGLLRPLDAIQPYRLEMGSRLKTRRGASLYDYWGDRIATALNARGQAQGSEVLINCASQEYFGAVDPKRLKLRVITPSFLEDRGGTPKIVSFFAKKARGAMARFIIENRLTDPRALCDFDHGGYTFDPARSTPDAPVFLRSVQETGRLAAAS